MKYNGSEAAGCTLHDAMMTDYLSDKTTQPISGGVSFYRDGKLHRALLYSFCNDGARFISRTIDVNKIAEGRAGEYYLTTAYGSSKCRGITRKITRFHPVIIWEIEFIELSGNDEDPINKALTALHGNTAHPSLLSSVTGEALPVQVSGKW